MMQKRLLKGMITGGCGLKIVALRQPEKTGVDWIWQQDEMVCKHAEPRWLAPKSEWTQI